MPGRGFVRVLVTASFVTPPFLGAIAWEILAAPNSGLLNQWYRWLYDLPPFVHLLDIYSVTGLIFVDTCYAFPFVFVLVANGLDRTPGDMEDASAILGAKPWRTAWRITLPLALPAVLAGMMVAFLRSLTLFGTPAILALPGNFHTITTKIWSLFQYPPNPGLAAAASIPLLVLTILLLRAERWVLGRRSYAVIGAKNSPPRPVDLKAWRWPALALCLLVLCNPVFLPYLALVRAALSKTIGEPLTLATMTLQHVRFVFFEFSPTRLALQNTVILAVATATVGTALALVIAYVASRKVIAGHRALAFLATAPIAVPGHRPRRRPVPRLHARAGGALRDAVDPVPRLPDDRASGRLSAAPIGVPEPAPGARGSRPAVRRRPHADAEGHPGAAAQERPCSPPGASSSSASCASSPPP